MRVDDWLRVNTKQLQAHDISSARLDCLILLEEALQKDRGWLLAHLDLPLSPTQIEQLDRQITRRTTHEPLAYIRGGSEFYGRTFAVNNHTLEPRPETETMIQMLEAEIGASKSKNNMPKEAPPLTQNWHIIDIGTGSGVLAITAKLLIPSAIVTAIDIDSECLRITHSNASAHRADIATLQGDLLEPLLTSQKSIIQPIIILANLPYVPTNWNINKAAQHEPRQAIFGGKDGLELYRRLFDQIKASHIKISDIFTESLPPQQSELASIAAVAGYTQHNAQDLIQHFKTT